MSMPRLLAKLTTFLALSVLATAGDDPLLEQRLARLAEKLEEARVQAHIPGMSIAVVKDDEIVFARGFGYADVENKRPADEHTLYAVGSTTKAFTATLVGMLVDEGKASWDDPVTRFLPYFDLQVKSNDAGAEATLRDLLSHRHGFTRMGILWLGHDVSREEILRTAAGAEPWDEFREDFHYCNVTYLAAGVAAGVAGGSSWDELMAERILEPLEMGSSSLSVKVAGKDARMAKGYAWDDSTETLDEEKLVDLDAIGPAGSINSNVLDMAQWVRLQLGRGELNEMQLITRESLRETWTPQIAIGDGAAYGLGWMLHQHDGRKVVEHGGNINGFTAEVALMPDEGLGFVLLMNLSVSPLQSGSVPLVFDALVGEWEDETVVADTSDVDFDELAGVYVANFATFNNEEFEVQIKESGLALHIPSQRTFDLKAPDAEGKWVFAMTDQIAVSFQRNEAGKVVGMVLHQAGFNFEVPRRGVVAEPEAPLAELEKYLGTFRDPESERTAEITVLNGHLTVRIRNKTLPLNLPDGTGHATLRARPEIGVTFHVDAEDKVGSLTFKEPDEQKLFVRAPDAKDEDLPTVDEVMELRRTAERVAALRAAGGTKAHGEVWIAQAGVRGTVEIYTRGLDHYANHLDFGKFGSVKEIAAGDEAWSYNALRGGKALKGDELAQALLSHPAATDGDWRDYFDAIEVVRLDELDGRPTLVLSLTKEGLPGRTYWVDAETGDVMQVKQILFQGSIRIPTTVRFSEFAEVDGFRTAKRVESKNPMSGRVVITIHDFEKGLELPDELFRLEGAEAPR